ncbi:MAG: aldehyde dehydrogenase (NADP(+)) [Verrucomicrobia bacterium]|jgi:2,5-dioxopentanoate dehydrogenase|nr:aldehyde dehydrogenase (NADP(+)) [Verrucomicrobiota bacterium]
MELTGHHLIGETIGAVGQETFQALDPSSQAVLTPNFHEATVAEAGMALRLGQECFDTFRGTSAEVRATFLDAIADEVMALGDALLERAHQETGLPMARLTGERGRAVNQAKLFAQLIREGSWVDARIDLPLPDRQPLPKPDVRRLLSPVGPVVVFGASNFPLAISVVGTDTVSALGAGCPVVVKGHPGHPGVCEMLGRAIQSAAKKCGLPSGVFSLLQGAGHALGVALVQHPITQAVAFTGSLRGGRALFDVANARKEPIPFYAEMGSVNPVFVLPGAAAERGEAIAEQFVQSVGLGVGQFCTNPGILIGLKSDTLDILTKKTAEIAANAGPATMLHQGIAKAYADGLERMESINGVKTCGLSSTPSDSSKNQAACHIFEADINTLFDQPALKEENFGPSSIILKADTAEQLEQAAEGLEGQLTATIHGNEEDLKKHAKLIRILERKVGRLIFNGFPTGIEVCPSMHHGGPYPASTHSFFTSIGTASILRFVRPLCFQGFPDMALPIELRNKNERGILRLVDNTWTREDID